MVGELAAAVQAAMADPIHYFEAADETRARLVAGVTAFAAELSRSGRAKEDGLAASWGALVKLLALTPPAQTRQCPSCNAVAMRAATRCQKCWGVLAPLADLPMPQPVAGGLSEF